MKDYYVVLGVSRGDPPESIRDAYRQLAKRHHPDLAGPENTDAFREITEAYDVLSDAARRARHDQGLRRAEGRLDVAPDSVIGPAEPPAEPLVADPVSIPRGFRRVAPSPDELFERLTHNLLRGRAAKGERPRALDVELALSPAEAARGGVLRLGVPAFRTCPACGGRGGDFLWPCPRCDDRGAVEVEAPVGVRLPPGVRDGTLLELPLDAAGIANLYLRLLLRVDA